MSAVVAVTGGCGFIGTHLLPLLVASGSSEVRVTDQVAPRAGAGGDFRFFPGDLATFDRWHELLDGVEIVFHLAWASVPASSTEDPVGDVQASLVPTVRLLEKCVTFGVRRVVFISSGGAVYGLPRSLPIREDHPTEPISAYGISKLAGERYLALFHHLYGLSYSIVRPSVPYGEYQNPCGRQGAVAVFLGRIARREPVVVFGDAEKVVRDFFYVGDLARACIAASRLSAPTATYNLGAGHGISLAKLLDAIRCVVGRNVARGMAIRSLPPRPFDVPEIVLDSSRAAIDLGWRPEVGLLPGLERTWRWVRDSQW